MTQEQLPHKKIINQLKKLETTNNKHQSTLISDSIQDLITISMLSQDTNNLKLINASIKELLNSFKVFQPHKEKPKLCIFGSARTQKDHPNYLMTIEMTEKITQMGYDIITGAGPGIMEAGNKGAKEGSDFGLNILLPFEQTANPYILGSDRLVNFKYFFTRKLIFVKETHALVALPGGFGTHDELFEVLTLIQTGRCAPRPIILLSNPKSNYWNRWHSYVKNQLYDRHYISEEDLNLFKITSNVDEAIQWIQEYYSIYHSVRYTDSSAIIRVNKRVSQSTLDHLSNAFSSIIPSGKIEQFNLSEIDNDYDIYPDKPRLVFKFDQTGYGKLNQLIIQLNKLEE